MGGTAQVQPGLTLPLPLQRCLRDILDGFFPSELQRLYPDGVPFQVTGCSSNHLLCVGILEGGGHKQLPQASFSLRREATVSFQGTPV